MRLEEFGAAPSCVPIGQTEVNLIFKTAKHIGSGLQKEAGALKEIPFRTKEATAILTAKSQLDMGRTVISRLREQPLVVPSRREHGTRCCTSLTKRITIWQSCRLYRCCCLKEVRSRPTRPRPARRKARILT